MNLLHRWRRVRVECSLILRWWSAHRRHRILRMVRPEYPDDRPQIYGIQWDGTWLVAALLLGVAMSSVGNVWAGLGAIVLIMLSTPVSQHFRRWRHRALLAELSAMGSVWPHQEQVAWASVAFARCKWQAYRSNGVPPSAAPIPSQPSRAGRFRRRKATNHPLE